MEVAIPSLNPGGPLQFCGHCLQNFGMEPVRDRGHDKTHLRWCLLDGLPGIALEALALIAQSAYGAWSAVSSLTFERVQEERLADIIMTVADIDGPGRILGQSELPPAKPIHQIYDRGERWRQSVDPGTVMKHEIGHALGLQHDPRAGALMSAYYDPAIKDPTPRDVARIQALYDPPTPPPIPPGAGTPGGPIIIRIFGAEQIDIPGYKVTKL